MMVTVVMILVMMVTVVMIRVKWIMMMRWKRRRGGGGYYSGNNNNIGFLYSARIDLARSSQGAPTLPGYARLPISTLTAFIRNSFLPVPI